MRVQVIFYSQHFQFFVILDLISVLPQGLLNDSRFEPKVIQAVSPQYRRLSSNSNKRKDSKDEGRKRSLSGKGTFYAASNRRYSSMNSLHVSSVLHSPDVVEIINCFAKALHGNILNSLESPEEEFTVIEIYNEMVHPMVFCSPDFDIFG